MTMPCGCGHDSYLHDHGVGKCSACMCGLYDATLHERAVANHERALAMFDLIFPPWRWGRWWREYRAVKREIRAIREELNAR